MLDTEKRPGRITASRALDMMTKGRGKDKEFGETALTYAKELALKRIGFEPDDIKTWQMEWGNEWEPHAFEVYTQSRGEVLPSQFVTYEDYAGASPDGFVGTDGLLEIKCPQWKAHVDHLLNGPARGYVYQMQFQMFVTGRKWCDFFSFHPHFPDHIKGKVIRVERDETLMYDFADRLPKFEAIVVGYVKALE